jgi:hypothetical protein
MWSKKKFCLSSHVSIGFTTEGKDDHPPSSINL